MMEGNRYAVSSIHKCGELGSMKLYLGYVVAVLNSEVPQLGQRSTKLEFILELAPDYTQPLEILTAAQDSVKILPRGIQ
jgi:hypothetical protein